jgi:diguanylate cyclase (GGDEF)-like protein/PAS domain S-box-containing protein
MRKKARPSAKTVAPSQPSATPGEGEDRYRAIVEKLPVGVYRTTPDGTFVEANPELVRMLGFKKASDLFRCNVREFYVKAEDRDSHMRKMSSRPKVFQEFELRRADGRRFWVRDHCRRIKDRGGRLHYDGILIDITARKTAERRLDLTMNKLRMSNKKLEEQSLSDDLTGLYNRRGFFTFGLQQMKMAKRLKADIYLVFLDIDNLKEVNDAEGHPVGDLLLQGVAAILKGTLRESDIIGRIGGDEFALLAMRSKGQGERALLARIEEGVAAFRTKGHARLRLSVSMGLVRIDPKKYQQLEDFLAHADFLMYQQKRRKEKEREENSP